MEVMLIRANTAAYEEPLRPALAQMLRLYNSIFCS